MISLTNPATPSIGPTLAGEVAGVTTEAVVLLAALTVTASVVDASIDAAFVAADRLELPTPLAAGDFADVALDAVATVGVVAAAAVVTALLFDVDPPVAVPVDDEAVAVFGVATDPVDVVVEPEFAEDDAAATWEDFEVLGAACPTDDDPFAPPVSAVATSGEVMTITPMPNAAASAPTLPT